jgi:ribosomal protein L40E
MFKKYSPRLIYSYRSYKIPELCKIYKDQKLNPQTIRKWIKKSGLDAFLYQRDYYIYGAVWKEFLTNRNKQHKEKRSLDFEQFKCFKCKAKLPPLDNVITKLTTGFNDCIKAFGVCRKCGDDELERSYKRLKLDKIREVFKIELDELTILCNSSTSTNKTHSNSSQKVLGSEPRASSIEAEDLPLFKFINENNK